MSQSQRRSNGQRPSQQVQQQQAPGPHAIPTPQPGLPPPNAHPPGFPSTQQHYYAPQPLTSASIFIPSPANVTIDPKLVGPPPPTAASQSQAPLSNMYNSISNRPPSNMYNNSMFEPSGMSDNTAYTAMESQRDLRATSIGPDGVVPGRLTDTEIRVKVNGDLPLWYMQEKPKVAKYTKHMLHLFGTGVCVLVGKTHAYFLKILQAEMGDTPKHVKVMYSQVLFLRIGDSDNPDKTDEGDKPKLDIPGGKKSPLDAALTYYSWNEGETLFKTGDRGETHVLLDHFTHLKKQPNRCVCGNQSNPCKCMNEAKRFVLEDPSAYQQFPGTTGKC
ncbi:hypothetical protein RvY_18618-1 [Ramazzottius varieornatus]|uniref:Uncharacterized protein n=1 Tax=Ramazzottius varieornatus TaxID=947166 RepID=A0A1D1W6H3_RAMVA|nr:hypothetical protein RvY_18618-1 [Ramazzottius varieornatus]